MQPTPKSQFVWWFHPIPKICESDWTIIPNTWTNKKCSKAPTSHNLYGWPPNGQLMGPWLSEVPSEVRPMAANPLVNSRSDGKVPMLDMVESTICILYIYIYCIILYYIILYYITFYYIILYYIILYYPQKS